MERELIEKLARAVRMAEKIGDQALSRKKILAKAMDKYRIPDDTRQLRESYEVAVLDKMAREEESAKEQARKEEERKRLAAENRDRKLREHVLAKPSAEAEKTTELAINDEFTEDVLEGRISKEDLENPHFKYKGKKLEDFYFGPPR